MRITPALSALVDSASDHPTFKDTTKARYEFNALVRLVEAVEHERKDGCPACRKLRKLLGVPLKSRSETACCAKCHALARLKRESRAGGSRSARESP